VIETSDAEPRWELIMRHPVQGGRVEHVVRFHGLGTSRELDLPEPLRARIACHVLLTWLPDTGLPEALESLAEMWRFHHLPAPPPRQLPVSPSIPVKLMGEYVRPVFPVTEE
jgi:hypothetical protein